MPPVVVLLSRHVHPLPALIADLDEQAAWCYVDFFTANIRNPNARRAYLIPPSASKQQRWQARHR
jgi:hypothetical protein